MRSQSHPVTFLFVSLIIGGGFLMNAGCGLHFSTGKHNVGKGKNVSPLYSDEAVMVLDDPYGQTAYKNGMKSAFLLEDAQPGSGLTDNESILEEDPFAKGWPPEDSAQDYWARRDQAELLTSQAGLRDVLFEFDSWQLTEEAKRILAFNAQWLKAHSEARVTIEGHCDERGTRAYNYVLGEKRAKRTRNYLASLGVSPEQLATMSYGKDNPYCRNSTRECFKQNRRAHLVLGTAIASSIQEDMNESNRFKR